MFLGPFGGPFSRFLFQHPWKGLFQRRPLPEQRGTVTFPLTSVKRVQATPTFSAGRRDRSVKEWCFERLDVPGPPSRCSEETSSLEHTRGNGQLAQGTLAHSSWHLYHSPLLFLLRSCAARRIHTVTLHLRKRSALRFFMVWWEWVYWIIQQPVYIACHLFAEKQNLMCVFLLHICLCHVSVNTQS